MLHPWAWNNVSIKIKISKHGLITFFNNNPIIFKLLRNWLNVTKSLHKAQQEKNYIFQQNHHTSHYTIQKISQIKSRISLLRTLAFHNSSCFVNTVTVWICTEGQGLHYKVSVSERWPGTCMFIPSVVVWSVISEHCHCRKRVVLDVLKSCSNLKQHNKIL